MFFSKMFSSLSLTRLVVLMSKEVVGPSTGVSLLKMKDIRPLTN